MNMANLEIYKIPQKHAVIITDTFKLGKILNACIQLSMFVIGYNRLEIVNGDDQILIAFASKKDSQVKEQFEKLTNVPIELAIAEGDNHARESHTGQ